MRTFLFGFVSISRPEGLFLTQPTTLPDGSDVVDFFRIVLQCASSYHQLLKSSKPLELDKSWIVFTMEWSVATERLAQFSPHSQQGFFIETIIFPSAGQNLVVRPDLIRSQSTEDTQRLLNPTDTDHPHSSRLRLQPSITQPVTPVHLNRSLRRSSTSDDISSKSHLPKFKRYRRVGTTNILTSRRWNSVYPSCSLSSSGWDSFSFDASTSSIVGQSTSYGPETNEIEFVVEAELLLKVVEIRLNLPILSPTVHQVHQWNTDDVVRWLRVNRLEQWILLFRDHQVIGTDLLTNRLPTSGHIPFEQHQKLHIALDRLRCNAFDIFEDSQFPNPADQIQALKASIVKLWSLVQPAREK